MARRTRQTRLQHRLAPLGISLIPDPMLHASLLSFIPTASASPLCASCRVHFQSLPPPHPSLLLYLSFSLWSSRPLPGVLFVSCLIRDKYSVCPVHTYPYPRPLVQALAEWCDGTAAALARTGCDPDRKHGRRRCRPEPQRHHARIRSLH